MHSFLPLPDGSPMSKPRKPGAVCTQRFAFITFENSPTTPFAPGGTDIAASSMSS